MSFFTRELSQKEYRLQSYDVPKFSKLYGIRPGDIWYGMWYQYHIDKVKVIEKEINVYATKIKENSTPNKSNFLLKGDRVWRVQNDCF